jgi:hypothetical protein
MDFIIDADLTNNARRRRSGGSRANALLNVFSPANGIAGSFADNTLAIRDPVTPANDYSGPLINTVTGLFNRLTYTRAGTAYDTNGAGGWNAFSANVPRIAVGSYGRRMQIEVATTNLLLNTDTLGTQSPTVAAVLHTLSFTGTGTVTLSGVFTGSLVGTGAANRVQLQFTPTAGVLTCTVTGDVRFAQLEALAWATSYMPSTGSQGTRNAETCTISTFNLTQAAGTIYVRAVWDGGTAVSPNARAALAVDNGTGNESNVIYNGSSVVSGLTRAAAATQALLSDTAGNDGVPAEQAYAFTLNDIAGSRDGRTVLTDSLATMATTTILRIGSYAGANYLNGGIMEFAYLGTRISNAQLQALTS